MRGELTRLGYLLRDLHQAGLVTAAGYDAYIDRIVIPLDGNLYGRSLSASAPPHRFLPGAKGGLYRWQDVRQHPEVIVVEGLFDYATLWQAGFQNVTCSFGNSSQYAPVSAALRCSSNRLSDFRRGPKRQWATGKHNPLREVLSN